MKENIESINDPVLQEDLEIITNCNIIKWDKFKRKSILITGATGLIGNQLVKSLACANRLNNLEMMILVMVRNLDKAKKIFGHMLGRSDVKLVVGDVTKLSHIDEEIDYIIHGASLTSSQDFVNIPVETIKTGILGTMNILELAKEKCIKGMVYLSSMEVYGICDTTLDSITEKDYGYIDPMDNRSSYSEGKRMVECMCKSYSSQYQIPIKVARLVQTFGPGVDYEDNRVFAQFAKSIIEKRNIILHTKGDTIRSYCYTRDAITAILTILTEGKNGHAYNVANDQTTVSIRDMAEMLIKSYGEPNTRLVFEIDDITKYGYAPTLKMRINTNKIYELGWKAEINLLEMYERMIKSLLYEHELQTK